MASVSKADERMCNMKKQQGKRMGKDKVPQKVEKKIWYFLGLAL